MNMFGGSPKWKWGKSIYAQQQLAKTTVLEFGEQTRVCNLVFCLFVCLFVCLFSLLISFPCMHSKKGYENMVIGLITFIS